MLGKCHPRSSFLRPLPFCPRQRPHSAKASPTVPSSPQCPLCSSPQPGGAIPDSWWWNSLCGEGLACCMLAPCLLRVAAAETPVLPLIAQDEADPGWAISTIITKAVLEGVPSTHQVFYLLSPLISHNQVGKVLLSPFYRYGE